MRQSAGRSRCSHAPDRCRKIVGVDISDEFMAEAFTRLGFEFTREGSDFVVKSPAYRFDIEIEEDLVEEVARLYGYEKLPDLPPLARCAMRCPAEGTRSNHALRVSLAGLGYQELVNFSFVQEQWEKDFAGNRTADSSAQPDREPAFCDAHAAFGRPRRCFAL